MITSLRSFRLALLPPALSVLLLTGFPCTAALPAESVRSAGSSNLVGLGCLPLCFEPFQGQADDSVRFLARTAGAVFGLSATQAVLTLRVSDPSLAPTTSWTAEQNRNRSVPVRTLSLVFVDPNPQAPIAGVDRLPARINYLSGNNPAKWKKGAPGFARLQVGDLYPGINLVYYGSHQQLEYDLVVAPGADPALIRFRIAGADRLQIGAQGDLILQLGTEQIQHQRPTIYQWDGTARKQISGGYRLTDPQTVAFRIGTYNRELPLIIDPVLSYSSFLGGLGSETARAVALDKAGNIYVTGDTLSAELGTPNAFQPFYQAGFPGGIGDAFVAKFDPTGSTLLCLTYIGGSGDDAATSLALDTAGNAYIAGVTDSTDFPISPGAASGRIGGVGEFFFGLHPYDAFITKLSPDLSDLIYSTYLGGSGADEALAIAVDSASCAYVAGFTASSDFPLVNSFQSSNAGKTDAFVTKIAADGSSFVYSTYLGGSGDDHAHGIAVDDLGRAYVTGYTVSTNFPVFANAFQTNRPLFNVPSQVFVSRLSPNGAALERSTYLGGVGGAVGAHIVLDRQRTVYLTGSESGAGFPLTPGNLNPGGIFKSGNGAASWTSSNAGLTHSQVQGIGIDPANPAKLYIGTGRGISRSTDGGGTWQPSLDAFSQFVTFAIDPATPSTIYAGATNVMKSVDSGVSWSSSSKGLTIPSKQSSTNQSPNFVRRLVLDRTATGTLYAGTSSGVFKSTDAADNWKKVNNGLGNLDVRDLVIDPANPSTLYAATGNGVFRTTDSGGRWSAINQGLTNLVANALAISPASPPTIYVGLGDGTIFQRADAGTNWNLISAGLAASNSITVLAVDPATPTTLYAGGLDGLFKSVDAGANWAVATNGLPALPIATLAINSVSPSILYVGAFRAFGGSDAFLTRFNPDLDSVIYSIVFGGDATDQGMGVALDEAGNAFVVGSTTSFNFPTFQTAGYRGSLNSGSSDAFVTVVNSNASAFVYSTYLGGSGNDYGLGIAVDSSETVSVVGQTFSPDFPTFMPFQSSFHGPSDAFLARIQTNFSLVHVTVQTVPAGIPVIVDGLTNATPVTFDWPFGSSHLVSALPQSAGTNIQSVWTSWSDGGALSHFVEFTNDAAITANYKTQYFLSMAVTNLSITAPDLQTNAAASGALSPGSGWLDVGTTVAISATPPLDDTFSGWLGTGNGSFTGAANPASITMNGPITQVAAFAGPLTNRLTVTITGSGTVSPDRNGQVLKVGQIYTMTAKPAPGFVFSDWSVGFVAGSPELTYVATSTVPKLSFEMTNGLVLAARFIPNPFGPVKGTYSGLFFNTNSISDTSSGFMTVSVTDLGKFSTKFQVGGRKLSFSGQFNSSGAAFGSFVPSGGGVITIALQLDLTGGNVLTGTITVAGDIAELVANRPVFSAANPPPNAGRKYTLLMPGATDSITLPAGDTYGTVTVDSSGNLRFSGTLADGTRISQSSFISAQGQWPFYSRLYSGNGLILGWITFATRPEDDFNGTLAWFKLPIPKANLYAAGFTIENEAVGSLYSFTNGIPLLDFGAGSGLFVVENGKVFPSLTNYIVLDNQSKVSSTNQMSLTINTSSGLFQGSAVDPVTRKSLAVRGALLQKQNRGAGSFLNDGQAGGVLILPPKP